MSWLVVVEWLARLIFLIIFFLSVWSLSIIFDRYRFFKPWKDLPTNKSIEEQISEKKIPQSESDPRLGLLNAIQGVSPEKVDPIFTAYCNNSQKQWSQGFQVLGTLGSTTPFVGLLGTILGIIVSFGELSNSTGDMQAVMFSLAEALLLTAAGLAVAIPAVIAFNAFNSKVLGMLDDMETIKELYKANN